MTEPKKQKVSNQLRHLVQFRTEIRNKWQNYLLAYLQLQAVLASSGVFFFFFFFFFCMVHYTFSRVLEIKIIAVFLLLAYRTHLSWTCVQATITRWVRLIHWSVREFQSQRTDRELRKEFLNNAGKGKNLPNNSRSLRVNFWCQNLGLLNSGLFSTQTCFGDKGIGDFC